MELYQFHMLSLCIVNSMRSKHSVENITRIFDSLKICLFIFYKNICVSGISKRVERGAKYILRVPYAEAAILPCDVYGELPLLTEWWLVRPEILIGSYDFENRIITMNWTRSGSYEVIAGGLLLIKSAKKELVERYRCTVSNSKVCLLFIKKSFSIKISIFSFLA